MLHFKSFTFPSLIAFMITPTLNNTLHWPFDLSIIPFRLSKLSANGLGTHFHGHHTLIRWMWEKLKTLNQTHALMKLEPLIRIEWYLLRWVCVCVCVTELGTWNPSTPMHPDNLNWWRKTFLITHKSLTLPTVALLLVTDLAQNIPMSYCTYLSGSLSPHFLSRSGFRQQTSNQPLPLQALRLCIILVHREDH